MVELSFQCKLAIKSLRKGKKRNIQTETTKKDLSTLFSSQVAFLQPVFGNITGRPLSTFFIKVLKHIFNIGQMLLVATNHVKIKKVQSVVTVRTIFNFVVEKSTFEI